MDPFILFAIHLLVFQLTTFSPTQCFFLCHCVLRTKKNQKKNPFELVLVNPLTTCCPSAVLPHNLREAVTGLIAT